jgi:putative YhbY family RNA-binding protein
MKSLSPAQRRALRARAHGLDPVVIVGTEGLTRPVLAEIERNLAAHGLIKIRVAGVERGEREALLASICRDTGAAPVQHIGKVLVVFREQPEPDADAKRPDPARRAGRAGR